MSTSIFPSRCFPSWLRHTFKGGDFPTHCLKGEGGCDWIYGRSRENAGEMRAAFGSGETVVNVLTGEIIRL